MTKIEAHSLLDAVKQGMPATHNQITQALLMTGDFRPNPKVVRKKRGGDLIFWSNVASDIEARQELRKSK